VEGKSEEGVYRYSLTTKTEAQNFSKYIMNLGSSDTATDIDFDEESEEEEENYDETE
jgi:hypothetical protein